MSLSSYPPVQPLGNKPTLISEIHKDSFDGLLFDGLMAKWFDGWGNPLIIFKRALIYEVPLAL